MDVGDIGDAGSDSSESRPAPRAIIWGVFLIMAFATLGDQLIIAPLNRLIELNVCHDHYSLPNAKLYGGHNDHRQESCKLDSIQSTTARLLAAYMTLGTICETAIMVPSGYISDRYGRKTVLYCNVVAGSLAMLWVLIYGHARHGLDTRSILVGPCFYLLGGRHVVNSNVLLSILSDVSEDDLTRTKLFVQNSAVMELMYFVASISAAVAMEIHPLLPFWLSAGLFVACIPIVALLPDTRQLRPGVGIPVSGDAINESTPLMNNKGGAEDVTRVETACSPATTMPLPSTVDHPISLSQRILARVKMYMTMLRANRNVNLCLLAFFLTMIAKDNMTMLLLFVSKRFHIRLSEASFLLSLKAVISVVLFLAIIPAFLSSFKPRHWRCRAGVNAAGAFVSLVFLTLGSVLIAFSPTIWVVVPSLAVYTLGWGVNTFLMSIISRASMMEFGEQYIGRVYSAVGVCKTVGSAMGNPILAELWTVGLYLGGYGLGLPFWFSSILYALVALLIFQLTEESITDMPDHH